jgi:hypothetical protein
LIEAFCARSRRLGAQAGLAAWFEEKMSLRSKPLEGSASIGVFCARNRRLGAQAGLAAWSAKRKKAG